MSGQSLLIKRESSPSEFVRNTNSPTNSLKNIRKIQRKQEIKPMPIPENKPIDGGGFREAKLNDRIGVQIRITSDPLCAICHQKVWDDAHPTQSRKTLMFRHFFRNHLVEEMKFELLKTLVDKDVQDLLKCPLCPEHVRYVWKKI